MISFVLFYKFDTKNTFYKVFEKHNGFYCRDVEKLNSSTKKLGYTKFVLLYHIFKCLGHHNAITLYFKKLFWCLWHFMSKYVQSKYASFYYRALLWTTRIAMCSDKNLHKIWSSQIVPQMIFIKVHSIKRVVFLSLKKLAY